MSHSFQKVKRKVSFHPNFKGQDTMLVQSEIDFNYHNLYIDTKEPLCKTETIFWYVWISFLLLLFAYVHNMAYVFIRHFSLNMFELIVWSRCSFIFKYWFSYIEQDVNFKYDTQTWFKFDTCTLCLFWICENPVCVCVVKVKANYYWTWKPKKSCQQRLCVLVVMLRKLADLSLWSFC